MVKVVKLISGVRETENAIQFKLKCIRVIRLQRKYGTKVCRYNWHSAVSLGRPFPVLKY